MACACKSQQAGQVNAVKQVVKKVNGTVATNNSASPSKVIVRRPSTKRITYRRPI